MKDTIFFHGNANVVTSSFNLDNFYITIYIYIAFEDRLHIYIVRSILLSRFSGVTGVVWGQYVLNFAMFTFSNLIQKGINCMDFC